MKQYPVGGSAEVNYNPFNPADAVLEVRAASSVTWMIIAVMLFCIGAGMGVGLNFFLRQAIPPILRHFLRSRHACRGAIAANFVGASH